MANFSFGAEIRQWSASDGGSMITASVVKVLGNKVVLKKNGGDSSDIPILTKYTNPSNTALKQINEQKNNLVVQ